MLLSEESVAQSRKPMDRMMLWEERTSFELSDADADAEADVVLAGLSGAASTIKESDGMITQRIAPATIVVRRLFPVIPDVFIVGRLQV